MAARPMLASTDGDLVIMSTANEPVGFFWEKMTRVVSAAVATVLDWFRMTVRARDVSRFSRDFLEDERRTLVTAVYAREYECVFEDSGDRRVPQVDSGGRADGRCDATIRDLMLAVEGGQPFESNVGTRLG